jgi:hypothetical protein
MHSNNPFYILSAMRGITIAVIAALIATAQASSWF